VPSQPLRASAQLRFEQRQFRRVHGHRGVYGISGMVGIIHWRVPEYAMIRVADVFVDRARGAREDDIRPLPSNTRSWKAVRPCGSRRSAIGRENPGHRRTSPSEAAVPRRAPAAIGSLHQTARRWQAKTYRPNAAMRELSTTLLPRDRGQTTQGTYAAMIRKAWKDGIKQQAMGGEPVSAGPPQRRHNRDGLRR